MKGTVGDKLLFEKIDRFLWRHFLTDLPSRQGLVGLIGRCLWSSSHRSLVCTFLFRDSYSFIEFNREELADAIPRHGDAVEHTGAAHGLAVMGDEDELGAL